MSGVKCQMFTVRMSKKHPRLVSHVLGWTMFGASIILLLGAVGVGAITYEQAYQDRIFPGVRIGSTPVGELTKAEATARMQKVMDAYLGHGIPYALGGKIVTINPVISAPQDPDLTYEIIDVDIPTLVDEAFAVGRVVDSNSTTSSQLSPVRCVMSARRASSSDGGAVFEPVERRAS